MHGGNKVNPCQKKELLELSLITTERDADLLLIRRNFQLKHINHNASNVCWSTFGKSGLNDGRFVNLT